MFLNRFLFCLIFLTSLLTIGCQKQLSKLVPNNNPNFITLDTLQDNKRISLVSSYVFEHESLNMINTFLKDSVFDADSPFVRDLHIGFSIKYNNKIYTNIVGLDCLDCENYLGVYRGDSIDNIEGFKPLIIENKTDCFVIMQGYYHGCNGSFCNFGSILILKFNEDQIQQIYLFGIDKTLYSLNRTKANILNNGDLFLQMSTVGNDSLNLIFSDKIEIRNKKLKLCDIPGIKCIR